MRQGPNMQSMMISRYDVYDFTISASYHLIGMPYIIFGHGIMLEKDFPSIVDIE